MQYLTTCRASIFGARTCPGAPRFTVTTPIPQRSVTLSRLRILSKHRNNHTDQGRKRHDGAGGVRMFPLATQLIPVLRHNGPVIGRLICRKGPDEENDKARSNEQK